MWQVTGEFKFGSTYKRSYVCFLAPGSCLKSCPKLKFETIATWVSEEDRTLAPRGLNNQSGLEGTVQSVALPTVTQYVSSLFNEYIVFLAEFIQIYSPVPWLQFIFF